MLTRTAKPEIMMVDEVAAWLRVSMITVYRMAERHEIPAGKYGRSWRFRRDQLEEWIANRDAQNGRRVGEPADRARSAASKGGKSAAKT
jgi:excisionase family DNA binding protein